MLTVVTFLWGTKYTPDYVEKLRAGVRRHLKRPHRFLCLTEPDRIAHFSSGIERYAIEDPELIGRHCFVRLRLFDANWQDRHGVEDQLVSIDLDNVVTGSLDHLFNTSADFLAVRGVNMVNPNPINCSMFLLRRWRHPEVWSKFSLEAASQIKFHEFPDDQGWIWHCLPEAPGWELGPRSGIWAFGKGRGEAAWPKGNALPADARLVAFPGGRDPSKFMNLDWVSEHWR